MRGPLQFMPKYLYVEEEWKKPLNNDDKVTELLNKYKRENGKVLFISLELFTTFQQLIESLTL